METSWKGRNIGHAQEPVQKQPEFKYREKRTNGTSSAQIRGEESKRRKILKKDTPRGKVSDVIRRKVP